MLHPLGLQKYWVSKIKNPRWFPALCWWPHSQEWFLQIPQICLNLSKCTESMLFHFKLSYRSWSGLERKYRQNWILLNPAALNRSHKTVMQKVGHQKTKAIKAKILKAKRRKVKRRKTKMRTPLKKNLQIKNASCGKFFTAGGVSLSKSWIETCCYTVSFFLKLNFAL